MAEPPVLPLRSDLPFAPGTRETVLDNWQDGIGPKAQRPVTLDLSRTRKESNQMGTDEYVAFCNLVGAENFICINAGTGTISISGARAFFATATPSSPIRPNPSSSICS